MSQTDETSQPNENGAFGRTASCNPSARQKGDATAGHEPPVDIPDYELLYFVGRGAFGEVWICKSRHHGQYRAVKIVTKRKEIELDGIREYKKRVKNHPHIVPIEHVGEASGFYYCVMPLADDEKGPVSVREPTDYEPMTLAEHLRQSGPLALNLTLEIADQVLSALEHLHEANLVHCDVKPANILRVDGVWRLGDLGLLARGSQLQGKRRGTPSFLPPEGVQDRTTDLYALGMTIYLTAGGDLNLFTEFARGRRPLPQDDPRVDDLRRVILRACSEKQSERFQTAAQMRRALVGVRTSHSRKTTRVVGIASATLIIVLLAGVLSLTVIHRTTASKTGTTASNTDPTRLREQSTGNNEEIGSQHETIQEPRLTVLSMTINQYRGEQAAYIGEIGVTSNRCRFDDDVRVAVKLSAEAYCYLIAFNSDGEDQLCYPKDDQDEGIVPAKTIQFVYPTSPTRYFGLDDSTGLQAFVLLVSLRPLPDYEEWRSQVGAAPWKKVGADSVWRFDGHLFTRLDGQRGNERDRGCVPQAFADLCSFLKNRPHVAAIHAIAFPITAHHSDSLAEPDSPGETP